MFKEVEVSRHEEVACVVGLHGTAGLGKTTLCMSVVNLYASQYLGRSFLIEFPSDGDKSKIVEECKRALKKLTNIDNECLLEEVNRFEQVTTLMRKHMKANDVFLAIDNVWDSCREEAKSLLGVGFTAKSKIVVTSRSEQVLKDLLFRHKSFSYTTKSLPAPEHEEASQIVQNNFEGVDLRSLDKKQIDSLLERFKFNGSYHPLALKAIAQYLQRVHRGFKNIQHCLSVVLQGISNAHLQAVEELIRLSYENLTELKQLLFLDIVVFAIMPNYVTIPNNRGMYYSKARTYAEAHRWLCMLHRKDNENKEFHETEITDLIFKLASDGFIQIGEREDGKKTLEVHDLYIDFARREARNSPRFFMQKAIRQVEDMEWGKLDRVLLSGDEDAHFLELMLQRQECRNLRVLLVDRVKVRSEIPVNSMRSLRVLVLEEVEVMLEESGSCAASGVLELNGLVQLQILQVSKCEFVKSITGLNALTNLQRLVILECRSLTYLGSLSGLTCLESLELKCNGAMVEEECLNSALKVVYVHGCKRLRRIPDLSGLTCLERLELWWNDAMEEVGGEDLSPTLQHLKIRYCGNLRRFPSLKNCLQIINASRIGRATSVGSDLKRLKNLQILELSGIDWSTDFLHEQVIKHLTRLQSLTITQIDSIEKLEVGCLGSLTCLWVFRCSALEEIGDVSSLHCLEVLRIECCPRLKKVGGLVGISTQGHLKRLVVTECESLEASSIPDVPLIPVEPYVTTRDRTIALWNMSNKRIAK